MPRSKPEPREAPNVPNGWVSPWAPTLGVALAVAAGATGAVAPDVTGSDMVVLFFTVKALITRERTSGRVEWRAEHGGRARHLP